MKFLIWSPPLDQFSGGILALHKLYKNIKALGEECELTHSMEPISDVENTIVIYPEIIVGNPLQAKHVTRWILNTPGVIGGDGIYGPNDLIYKYANYFNAPDESRVSGILSAFETNLEIFQDFGMQRDIKRSYAQKKFKGEINEPEDSVRIDGIPSKGGNRMLAHIFNTSQTFYNYDNASFHSVQAALCGCLSIIHDDGKITPQEWRKKSDCFRYGIAYGTSPREIKWAGETIGFVRNYMKELEKISMQQAKEFINKSKSLL